ncbi:MAG: L,D-transpeptidase [Planctomycetota bacterium]
MFEAIRFVTALVVIFGVPPKPKTVAKRTPSPSVTTVKADDARIAVADPVAWQAALDRAGFSPGVIDGRLAKKTTIALGAFQRANGLPTTGRPDDATRRALGMDQSPSTTAYTISTDDERLVGPWPKTWHEKAKAKLLGYHSLSALVAERGHCSRDLLQRLNRKLNLDRIKAGDSLLIPNVASPSATSRAASIEIDFTDKIVYLLDKQKSVVGLYHCSIAKDKSKRPSGACRVKVVKENPEYLFDPAKWPEVKNVKRKLLIPPGPRCPVGLCWIGLSLDGYGIHGTPEPELIGKTGSHGCFRLTNWDAVELGKRIRVGTPVRFVERSALLAQRM